PDPQPHPLRFSSMEISSAAIVERLIQSSSRCENFLEITYASSFVISLLFTLTHIRCALPKPLNRPPRNRNSGRCTTNYLRTRQRSRTATFHITPGASASTLKDSLTI